jgi:O-antigen/teichoic acid export membrane protein
MASDQRLGAFALPAALGLLGITYLVNIDVILARHYLAPDAAGLYAAAAVLGRVIYFATYSIAGVMFPEVTTLHARNQEHFHVVALSLGLVIALALPLTLVYWTLPSLALLPFGKAFASAAPYLGPLALAFTGLSVSNLLINYSLSISDRRFVPMLLLACAVEPALIVLFHDSIAHIVTAVVVTNAALLSGLTAPYLWQRIRMPSSRS